MAPPVASPATDGNLSWLRFFPLGNAYGEQPFASRCRCRRRFEIQRELDAPGELPPSALAAVITGVVAFLGGTLFYGGQEIPLEGVADLKDPVKTALQTVIPNVYPRFAIADHALDFAKQLKALLNPATAKLHTVAPDLGLFDTQGSLQRESALVAAVLEVISDLEDEGERIDDIERFRHRRLTRRGAGILGWCPLEFSL